MANDDFNRADGNLTAPWGAATGWAALRVSSNQCGNSAGSDTDSAMRRTDSTSLRSIFEYRGAAPDGGPAHLDAAGNGYVCECASGTTVRIYDVTGGPNYHQIGGDALAAILPGDIGELRIDGNDIVYYKNSVETFRVTSTLFRTGLSPAIFIFSGTMRIDNWNDGAAGDTLFAQVLT